MKRLGHVCVSAHRRSHKEGESLLLLLFEWWRGELCGNEIVDGADYVFSTITMYYYDFRYNKRFYLFLPREMWLGGWFYQEILHESMSMISNSMFYDLTLYTYRK